MGESGLSGTEPHENPLVPNKKLRQIYTAMVEARLLDEYVVKAQRGVKPRLRMGSTHGQEACRVSTAIELEPGDLVSDAQVSPAMHLLSGAKLDSLFRQISAAASSKKDRTTPVFTEEAVAKRQLPWIDDGSDRLKIAMGAALTFKTLNQTNIVVAYAYRADVPKETWLQMLALAARLTLPMILVVLPDTHRKKKSRGASICAKARSAGIPGIPVDAGDAVALYRVAQESIGRTRGGDGPVLIECIAGLPAHQSGETDDPILHMKNFLVGRKICTDAWANHAGDAFRRKIAACKAPLVHL